MTPLDPLYYVLDQLPLFAAGIAVGVVAGLLLFGREREEV